LTRFFSLVKQQKFGLPVALTYDEAFLSIVSSLRASGNTEDNRFDDLLLFKTHGRFVGQRAAQNL